MKVDMKILLVDDNRDALNWGCRATSISLAHMLRSRFRINAIIDKKTVDGKIAIGSRLLERKYFSTLRDIIVSKSPNMLTSILGIKPDFISKNPRESSQNLVKYRHVNKRLKTIYDKVKSSDLIVINGEGSMIFTRSARRDLLFQLMIIDLATRYFGKPVFYVNAMVSDCPIHGRNEETLRTAMNSLAKCSGVSVRDFRSLELVRSVASDVNCTFIPDALFSWYNYFSDNKTLLPSNGDFVIPYPEEEKYFGKFNFSDPYICVGGSSLAACDLKNAVPYYANLVKRTKDLGLNVYLVQTCTGDTFLHKVADLTDTPIVPVQVPILMGGAILANARLFISGRYHPSIFASLGGTPCIFLGSNSHKTLSLQQVLEYDDLKEFPAIPENDACEEIFDMAKDILCNRNQLSKRILEVVKKRYDESKRVVELLKTTKASRWVV